MKKYIVRLEPAERVVLEQLVRVGNAAAYRIRHANILLAVDMAGPKMTDQEAARAFNVTARCIEHLRQRCVEQGLDAALERKEAGAAEHRADVRRGEGSAVDCHRLWSQA
jgi:hypothetical protein